MNQLDEFEFEMLAVLENGGIESAISTLMVMDPDESRESASHELSLIIRAIQSKIETMERI